MKNQSWGNLKNRKKATSLTWGKRVIFPVIVILISFLLLEVCLRVFFAFNVGPSVLLYGTPFHRRQVQGEVAASGPTKTEFKTYREKMTHKDWADRRTVIKHKNKLEGYSKYFPNQKRCDFDVETRERFEVTINNRGFRGRDFSDRKEPGVIRIVTLGASSTFGYFDRDDETYPVYLEEILNEEYLDKNRFEVLNLGVPHLKSWQIYSLFLNEVVPLDPDIVTLYAGKNDAGQLRLRDRGACILRDMARVFITAGFVESIINSRRSRKNQYSPKFEEGALSVSDKFIGNISEIYQECDRRGIEFIVANQQTNSQSIDRGMLKGLTYAEEVDKIRSKWFQSGTVTGKELGFLVHSVVMENLETWAEANQVSFVDVIDKMDQDRDVLVSYVHLSSRGNRMVAEAFAYEILKRDWGS